MCGPWECRVGLVIMTGREARRLKEVEVMVLSPGRFRTHWLEQVRAYLSVSGPLILQMGINKGLNKELGMVVVDRPARSGKWRECHSRNFFNYAEICQHKLNKTKEVYAFSAYFWIFSEILDFVEIFHWKLQQNKGSFWMCIIFSTEFTTWRLYFI